MALTESPGAISRESAVVTIRGVPRAVWLLGEHDIATDPELAETIAQAISLDDNDLVLDLSMVEFIGASTIGVIVRARQFLRDRSRSLTIRSPSAAAWHVLDLCGLASLLDVRPIAPMAAAAPRVPRTTAATPPTIARAAVLVDSGL